MQQLRAPAQTAGGDARAAAVFRSSDGDIRAVHFAVVTSAAATGAAGNLRRPKVRHRWTVRELISVTRPSFAPAPPKKLAASASISVLAPSS